MPRETQRDFAEALRAKQRGNVFQALGHTSTVIAIVSTIFTALFFVYPNQANSIRRMVVQDWLGRHHYIPLTKCFWVDVAKELTGSNFVTMLSNNSLDVFEIEPSEFRDLFVGAVDVPFTVIVHEDNHRVYDQVADFRDNMAVDYAQPGDLFLVADVDYQVCAGNGGDRPRKPGPNDPVQSAQEQEAPPTMSEATSIGYRIYAEGFFTRR